MSLREELAHIEKQIEEYTETQRGLDEEEALLEAELASLRLKLTKIKDKRYSARREYTLRQKEKESVVRKLELEEESRHLREIIEKKRAEAAEIIADAPWKDDAFSWQIDGAIQLPERALLGDKRGLGKTFSSIIWMRVKKAQKTLVCLRKEVASDFIKELSIREPDLFVYPLIGASPEQREFAAMLLNHQKGPFVVVTNIESWRRSVNKTIDDIMKINYDAVILDEAHNIKNSHTGTAQGFFKLADRIPKVLELTGTPIKNRPQEMFSLLHALYPHIFPREKKFLADFCVQMGQNSWAFTPMGLKSLVKQISAFYIARSPEDVGREIPPPHIIEYKLDFDSHPHQKQAYQVMTERSMAILNSGKVIPIVSQLAIMTRQAQVVSWPAGINFVDPETNEIFKFDVHESVKMDWAVELLQQLVEEGERVVLFSRFKPAIYELKRRLESTLSVAVITGDEKRDIKEIFDDFDLKTAPKNPKYRVLLATYQTVGESANLNGAAHMILYDRFWNPGNEDQAIGRIDRINSTRQATVHVPEVERTIDEYMANLIEEKRVLVSDFKDASTMQSRLLDHLKETSA